MNETVSARVDDGVLATGELDDGTSIRIVRADSLGEAELAEVVETLTAAFGRWPSFDIPVPAVEHLRWKLASPYGEHPGWVTLCHRDGRLAALSTSTFKPFLVHGRAAVGMGGGDAATHPDFQGQGLYSRRRAFQNEHLDPAFDVQIWYSQNATVLEHSSRSGGEFPLGNRILVRARVLDARRLAADRVARGRTRLPEPALRAALLWPRAAAAVAVHAASIAEDVTIERVERFDERIDEFFVEAARPFDVIAVRDAPYLNWRYCDRRGGEFLPLVAWKDGRVEGYAVLKAGERASLVDLLARPERLDVVAALLQRAVDTARRQGSMAVSAWLPSSHPYTETYKRLGFFDTRYGTGATVNDWGRGGHGALDFLRSPDARVHLAAGDSDWV